MIQAKDMLSIAKSILNIMGSQRNGSIFGYLKKKHWNGVHRKEMLAFNRPHHKQILSFISLSIVIIFLSHYGAFPQIETNMYDITGSLVPVESPNGKYAVYWKRNESKKQHEIWLKNIDDNGEDKEQLLLIYNRHTSVFWSPDSKKVIINDVLGSNIGEVYIYSLRDSGNFEKDEKLMNMINEVIKKDIGNSMDHLYIEAIKWKDDNSLILRVHGHGEKYQFDKKSVLSKIN